MSIWEKDVAMPWRKESKGMGWGIGRRRSWFGTLLLFVLIS